MTGGEVAAWLAAAGTVAVTVLGAVGAFLATRAKTRQEQQASNLGEAFKIIDLLKGENGRQQQQIDAKQESIDRLFAMHAHCEAGQVAYYGWMQEADRWMRRHSSGPGDDPPPLPPPPRPHGHEAEFTARTTAMNTGLSAALTKQSQEAAEALKARIQSAGGQP
jgi:hypothetical protein